MARIDASPQAGGASTPMWVSHRPAMAAAAVALSKAVYQETRLTYREAEAARIRTAQINGCMICGNWRLNRDLPDYLQRVEPGTRPNLNAARGAEPTPEFYEAIEKWRGSDLFSERERLAIEFSEKIGQQPRELPQDEDLWARLHARFDDGEIVDLTYSITAWIATGRFLHVLELDTICPAAPDMG